MRRLLPRLAMLGACLVGVLFSVRVIASEDLGYHLAYGEAFLDSGRPVDHDARLYTLAPAPDPARRPAPGPGCWYDDDGRYRFANANWLTQVLIAVVWRGGGVAGLNRLLVLLVAALFGLIAALCARLRAPPALAALGVLAIAVAAYPRLTLRPELLGYLMLVAQALVLAGLRDGRGATRAIPLRAIAALALIQILFVNLHGFFLLGLGLTGACVAGSALGLALEPRGRRRRLARVGTLALALVAQVAACFVNPWGWRLAALPVQTLAYLRTNGIGGEGSTHPWAIMGDLRPPPALADGRWADSTSIALAAGLLLVLVGAAGAARRRRWSWLLVAAALSAVALSAERNTAVGLMLAVPFALGGAGRSWIVGWAARCRITRAGISSAARPLAAAVALLAAGVAWSIVDQRLYTADNRPVRFGRGLSRAHLPLGAAEWLSRHALVGRIWCEPAHASTIYGFAQPEPALNLVTNTWAYPPELMARVLDASQAGSRPFESVAAGWSPSACVASSGPFLRQLVAETDWVPVHVEGRFVVLVRRGGPDGALAERLRLRPERFDLERWTDRARRLDPVPGRGLRHTASALADLGWYDAALGLLDAARLADPRAAGVWIQTADALFERARRRPRRDAAGIRHDLRGVLEATDRAWALDGDERHRKNRAVVERLLAGVRAEN